MSKVEEIAARARMLPTQKAVAVGNKLPAQNPTPAAQIKTGSPAWAGNLAKQQRLRKF